MDRTSLSQKYGIIKQNKAKERQKLKKNIRYYNLDLQATSRNFPGSCSELFKTNKLKIKPFDGDVTSKLLALASPPAANTLPLNRSTHIGDKEHSNVKCDLKNCMSSEISVSDNKRVVGSTEEFKNTHFANCISSSGNGNKDTFFGTSKQNCKEDAQKDVKEIKKGQGIQSPNTLNINKNVKKYAAEVNKQQSNVKSNGKRSVLRNAEQADGFFNPSASPKNCQNVKDCAIVNVKKRSKSGEKTKKIDNTTVATSSKEQSLFSAQEEKYVSSQIKNKKQKSNAEVESNSGIIKNQVGTSPLVESSKKKNKKTKIKSLDNENCFDYERTTGGWNVIDSAQCVENSVSSKRDQKSAKKKNNSKILNMFSGDNVTQKLKVPSKCLKKANNSSNQEFYNSQPILVEMRGANDVSSNPFHAKVFDLKKKTVQPSFSFKSDLKWKPCKNLCSTDKWEVQYGNTSQLTKGGQQFTKTKQQLSNVEDRCMSKVAVSAGKELKADTIGNFKNTPNTLLSTTNSTKNTEETTVLRNHCDSSELHQLFDVSGTEVILALPQSSSVFFQGVVRVKVLLGNISVLGLEISHTNPQEYTVYSPSGFSLLSFQSCVKHDTFSSNEEYWELVKEKIRNTNAIILDKVVKSVSPFSSLILLRSVSETLVTFLLKYFPSLNYFPSTLSRSKVGEDSSGILRALFVGPRCTEYKLYKQSSVWNSVTSFVMKKKPGDVRVLAFGGKGVGKSTFLRFLVNQTLSQFKEVLYIDFDIGQCEFSIPGCVSASVVKNPLLGPNFTHLTQPERLIYIGEINVSVCVDRYLQSVQHILDWCRNQPHLIKLPWFINTMGFVQGLGVELAVTIIKMVYPSDVIQIQSSVQERNFPFSLNFEEVQNHATSLRAIVNSKESNLHPFSFHMLPSTAESSDNRRSPWGVQANIARETVLISYFSQVVAPPAFSLLEVTPHILSFSCLKLCVSSEKVKYSDYLSAMNANLVALCKVQESSSLIPSDPAYPEILEKAPICHCFGFGIVRGVDMEKKKVFIISPLQSKKMNFVNCLVLGSVHLPERIFTSQDEARGTIPYVVEGALLPLARGVRPAKSVLKLKN